MKKMILVLLALAMCLSLCACSGGSQSGQKDNESVASTAASRETTLPKETESELPDGVRSEFKEAMDAYEAFYEEYCEFMAEYKKNPSDMTLLAKYTEMLQKMQEVNTAFEEWNEKEMNEAEMKYYLEVSSRVMQMLAEVAD